MGRPKGKGTAKGKGQGKGTAAQWAGKSASWSKQPEVEGEEGWDEVTETSTGLEGGDWDMATQAWTSQDTEVEAYIEAAASAARKQLKPPLQAPEKPKRSLGPMPPREPPPGNPPKAESEPGKGGKIAGGAAGKGRPVGAPPSYPAGSLAKRTVIKEKIRLEPKAAEAGATFTIRTDKTPTMRVSGVPADWSCDDVEGWCSQHGGRILKISKGATSDGLPMFLVTFDSTAAALEAERKLQGVEVQDIRGALHQITCQVLADAGIPKPPSRPPPGTRPRSPAVGFKSAQKSQSSPGAADSLSRPAAKVPEPPAEPPYKALERALDASKPVSVVFIDELYGYVEESVWQAFQESESSSQESKEVFLQQLPVEDHTEEEIQEWLTNFSKVGSLGSVIFIQDHISGELSGSAYVTFQERKDALLLHTTLKESDGPYGTWSVSEKLQHAASQRFILEAGVAQIGASSGCHSLILSGKTAKSAAVSNTLGLHNGPLCFVWASEEADREVMMEQLAAVVQKAISATPNQPPQRKRPAPPAQDPPPVRRGGGAVSSTAPGPRLQGQKAPASGGAPPRKEAAQPAGLAAAVARNGAPTEPFILVRGFAASWTEAAFHTLFAIYGGVKAVTMVSDNGPDRMCCVWLKDPTKAARAVEQLNQNEVGDDEQLEKCVISCSVIGSPGEVGKSSSGSLNSKAVKAAAAAKVKPVAGKGAAARAPQAAAASIPQKRAAQVLKPTPPASKPPAKCAAYSENSWWEGQEEHGADRPPGRWELSAEEIAAKGDTNAEKEDSDAAKSSKHDLSPEDSIKFARASKLLHEARELREKIQDALWSDSKATNEEKQACLDRFVAACMILSGLCKRNPEERELRRETSQALGEAKSAKEELQESGFQGRTSRSPVRRRDGEPNGTWRPTSPQQTSSGRPLPDLRPRSRGRDRGEGGHRRSRSRSRRRHRSSGGEHSGTHSRASRDQGREGSRAHLHDSSRSQRHRHG